MTITRRTILALALATVALPTLTAAPLAPAPVKVRITWTGGAQHQVDELTYPAGTHIDVGVTDFGGGVQALTEIV